VLASTESGAGSCSVRLYGLTTERIVKPLNISQAFIYNAYRRIGKASESPAPARSQTYNYDAYVDRWVTAPIGRNPRRGADQRGPMASAHKPDLYGSGDGYAPNSSAPTRWSVTAARPSIFPLQGR
jgi:hypothetical protein